MVNDFVQCCLKKHNQDTFMVSYLPVKGINGIEIKKGLLVDINGVLWEILSVGKTVDKIIY